VSFPMFYGLTMALPWGLAGVALAMFILDSLTSILLVIWSCCIIRKATIGHPRFEAWQGFTLEAFQACLSLLQRWATAQYMSGSTWAAQTQFCRIIQLITGRTRLLVWL
jgi:hypothetical protein